MTIVHSILRISTDIWSFQYFLNTIIGVNISRIINKYRKTQQFPEMFWLIQVQLKKIDFNNSHCSSSKRLPTDQWIFETFFYFIIGINIYRMINKSGKTQSFPEITLLILTLLKKIDFKCSLCSSTDKWIFESFCFKTVLMGLIIMFVCCGFFFIPSKL